MKTRVRFRPLSWNGPSTPDAERHSPLAFRAGWTSTLDRLDRELEHLDARDVVLELAIREDEIRVDGWPRSTARPTFPGVRLAFTSKHGPLMYATDAYAMWQHNVRAIALGLEALRAVDRYGVTRTGEQYRGWTALPAAPSADAVLDAAQVVAVLAGLPESATEAIAESIGSARKDAVRKAMRGAHPDTGGSSTKWEALKRAAFVLGVPL